MNSVFRLHSLICQSAPGSRAQGEEEAGVLAYIGEIMMFLLIPLPGEGSGMSRS